MTKNTHTSGGFLFALIFLNFFITRYILTYNIIYQILLIALFIHFSNFGAVFPDIDMKGSYISKRHPLLSRLFKKCKHRGLTHSIVFTTILYFISITLVVISGHNIVVFTICAGFLLGYISHLFLDILTKEGIEMFFPLRFNINIFFIKTGSKGEQRFHKFLKLVIALMIAYNIYLVTRNIFHIDLINYLNTIIR